MLLTMQEARQRLDLDADAVDDATLRALIAAASLAVTGYLGHSFAPGAQLPEAITAATVLAIAVMLDPEAAPAAISENRTFTSLLSPYQQPDRAGAT